MPKFTAPTINSGYLSTEALNQAFQDIQEAFENTVSRDGSTPNQLEADLDLNGHVLLNIGSSDNPNSMVTLETLYEYVDSRASDLIVQRVEEFTATAGQMAFVLTEFTYSPGSHNIAVYVNGSRVFTPTDYAETDSSTITFTAPRTLGDKVVVVQTDFLATVNLPTHSHAWTQITGKPEYASRWPAWDEVSDKPITYAPSAHNHDAEDLISGRIVDSVRGVYVQATEPSDPEVGDLWFW